MGNVAPIRLAILGPLRVEGPDGAIELKAHKQRVVLARAV
jgi:hypothetical protein